MVVLLIVAGVVSGCGEQTTAQLSSVQQVVPTAISSPAAPLQTLVSPTVKLASQTLAPTIKSQILESPIILGPGTTRQPPTPKAALTMPTIASVTTKSDAKTVSTVFSLTNGSILTIITPTITVGEVISLPILTAGASLRKSAAIPTMSYLEVLDLVATINRIDPYGGQTVEGPVKITMVYGLGTDGQTGNTSGLETSVASGSGGLRFRDECRGWTGPCPVEVQKCVNGACVSTGQVINRIENRPMWIVEYSNLPKGSVLKGGPAARYDPKCGNVGQPVCVRTSRVAYKIDELTKSVLSGIELN